ncbi:MAG: hypothetical protein L6R30_16790, partial [Thermoanaerobaculia bacterium]|nr:hypothetical protein [Thermoanaerobaculia bacterium]
PKTHRYRLTPRGRRVAIFFNRVYGRLLRPGLSYLSPLAPPGATAMSVALLQFEAQIDRAVGTLRLAA